jgi:hypothetical protein
MTSTAKHVFIVLFFFISCAGIAQTDNSYSPFRWMEMKLTSRVSYQTALIKINNKDATI